MVALRPAEWIAVGDGIPASAGAIFWVTYEDSVTGARSVALCVETKRGNSLVCRGDAVFEFGVHAVTHWRPFRTQWPFPAGDD